MIKSVVCKFVTISSVFSMNIIYFLLCAFIRPYILLSIVIRLFYFDFILFVSITLIKSEYLFVKLTITVWLHYDHYL